MSSNDNLNGIWPHCNEVDLNNWLEFLKGFPIRVREVFIYGGEPAVVRYIAELIKALLSAGILVTVYTNLSNIKKFIDLPESPRLRFVATFHYGQMKENVFLWNYRELSSRYNTRLEEIETAELDNSHVKPMCTREDSQSLFIEKNTLIIAPDLKIYCSCAHAYDAAKQVIVDNFNLSIG
jgi:organic radical activating enzyme